MKIIDSKTGRYPRFILAEVGQGIWRIRDQMNDNYEMFAERPSVEEQNRTIHVLCAMDPRKYNALTGEPL